MRLHWERLPDQERSTPLTTAMSTLRGLFGRHAAA